MTIDPVHTGRYLKWISGRDGIHGIRLGTLDGDPGRRADGVA